MEDRELLKLAAKAVGISLEFDGLNYPWRTDREGEIFDPIKDVNDAMALAVALRLEIKFLDGFKQVICRRHKDMSRLDMQGVVGYGAGVSMEPTKENVCLAIVKAAAEIGRNMP